MALGSAASADNENIGSGPLAKGRDPKARTKTVGGIALNDAVLLVAACWVFLFVLAHTLRHHNH